MADAVATSARGRSRGAAPGLVLAALWMVFAAAALITPADADLWGHLTFGRDIVQSGDPIQVDGYSFASDRRWINHEWLAEVVFFRVYRAAGSTGLILFKLGFIALVVLSLWRYLTSLGASRRGAAVLTGLAFVGTYWRTHTVRPQLFSVLLFAWLLIIMRRVEGGRRWWLAAVPPLVVIWVNSHGGWIVGAGVFALWTAMSLVEGRQTWTDRAWLAGTLAAAAAAVFINPYGRDLVGFLAETVRPERGDIEEWGSILTSPVGLGVPWALTIGAAALAVRTAGRPSRLTDSIVIVGLAVLSFRVSRLDAFFSLAVVVLLAPALIRAIDRRPWLPAPATSPPAGVMVISAVVALVALVPVGRIMAPYASCLTIQGGWVPDRDAAMFIDANQLQGRMLTWFDWGEYAIWHYGPGLQVSMDGRRETVFTERAIQAHRRFYAGEDAGGALLQGLNPDYIWLPTRLPVVGRLRGDGWTAIFDGPASVVFTRHRDRTFQPASTPMASARCFPGP